MANRNRAMAPPPSRRDLKQDLKVQNPPTQKVVSAAKMFQTIPPQRRKAKDILKVTKSKATTAKQSRKAEKPPPHILTQAFDGKAPLHISSCLPETLIVEILRSSIIVLTRHRSVNDLSNHRHRHDHEQSYDCPRRAA